MHNTPHQANTGLTAIARFAIAQHGGQRYGRHAFGYHLRQVVAILQQYGEAQDLIDAGWVHDIIEDTDVTREQLATRFTPRIADLAWAVTGVGQNRAERLHSVVLKIPTIPGSDKLKLADRYCNIRQCLADGNWRLLKMYLREHPVLATVLPPIMHPLRQALEALVEVATKALAEHTALMADTSPGMAP